jgi:hypothetical protein
MKIFRRTVALILSTALVVCAQGNSFDKVRYNGGSVYSEVDPHNWHNTLTVTSDMIDLALNDGTRVDIPPKSVTSLSYGQEAHRRVGTMIALAILVAPIALFGLLHKTRLHFIGIQYATPDKKNAGILLQGDKDNYRAILVALQGVTGAPVSVGEKEREFVPIGVRTEVTKTEEPSVDASQPAASGAGRASQAQPTAPCVVAITSTPAGADILVDDEFAGNTPSTINIPAGRHVVTARKSGYQDWVRSMNFYTGSITLSAELNRGTAEPPVVAPKPAVAAAPADKLPATDPVPTSSPWIGVSAQSNSDRVLVAAVEAGGPAAAVGIQAGDTILALDGRLMKGRSFESAVASLKPGSRIVINYVHGGAAREATLTVGTKLM